MTRRQVTVWVELVSSRRWPYVAVGRMLRRQPKMDDHAVFVELKLSVPDSLLLYLPEQAAVDAEGTLA